jgi:hypothetical protein
MNCDRVSGCCYTQLYDVEQEQNGLYTYDRTSKLSAAAEKKIRECLSRLAAIEKDSQATEHTSQKTKEQSAEAFAGRSTENDKTVALEWK